MKSSKIEYVIIIGIMALCLVVMFFSIRSCTSQIESNGGFKKIVIQAGKEIKDIKKQIDTE